jgi:hypothetical protein
MLDAADHRPGNARAVEERLLTTQEAAVFLGLSPLTLVLYRNRRVGPAFVKLGQGAKAAVRYPMSDLLAYCRRVTPDADR